MSPNLAGITEEELDTLVSIAIRRAEILDNAGAPRAADAWHEVMLYEERLADITAPSDVGGGVARAGAVWAALAAGRRNYAIRLAEKYLAEDGLPDERRAAIERTFEEDRQRRENISPAVAKHGPEASLHDSASDATSLETQQDVSLRVPLSERDLDRPYSQYAA